MPEFPERLGFYLPDAFPGDVKLLSDFFQGMVCIHPDAKTHLQKAGYLLKHRFVGLAQAGAELLEEAKVHTEKALQLDRDLPGVRATAGVVRKLLGDASGDALIAEELEENPCDQTYPR